MKTYGGPARPMRDCGCETPGTQPATSGPSLMPAVGGACEAGPENAPVSDEVYRCAIGVQLQPAIDAARRVNHVLGLRPYRVFLVWQERDRRRVWLERHRLELTPVRIVALDDVDLELSQAGLQPAGRILLRDVSPRQVNEDTLRGYLDGEPWGKDTTDREFFYEVQIHGRCAGQVKPRRRRFVVGTEPFHNGDAFEFRVGLVDQEIARSRDGEDRTIEPDGQPPLGRPRIVP